MQQKDTQNQQNIQDHPEKETPSKEMTTQVITLYCLCDDFLQAQQWKDDVQAQMSTAEVMTTSLVASAFFDGNHEKSRCFLKEHGYIPSMLSKCCFNRRCHLYPCPKTDKSKDKTSAPYRGYCASKKRYYYGLKGHLLVTASGQPVEFVLTPASTADIVGLRKLDLDLPVGATVTADAAYTDYDYENLLDEQEQVALLADRKCNSLRPHPAHLSYLCQHYRKRIETTFSTITEWLGRRLRAVTPEGWERKVFLTVVAYAILA